MKLLRHENVQLPFRGAQFNLLGVDYQRERTAGGQRLQMLPDLATWFAGICQYFALPQSQHVQSPPRSWH